MYETQGITCSTVAVTEQAVCPDILITYPQGPEFTGNIGTGTITIDVGPGNTILYDSLIRVVCDARTIDISHLIDYTKSVQTVHLSWEMISTVPDWTTIWVNINSSCGGTSGDKYSPYVEYNPGGADIVATAFTVTPTSCDAPCIPTIDITWTNNGNITGAVTRGYTINDVTYGDSNPVNVLPGASTHSQFTPTLTTSGAHAILPVLAPATMGRIVVAVSEPPIITCATPTPHYSSGCELLLNCIGNVSRDGVITEGELNAMEELAYHGDITWEEYYFINSAYNAGSVNGVCPGCFVGTSNIIATQINVTPSDCTSPCDITIDITWENTGAVSDSFYPGYSISIDGATPLEYIDTIPTVVDVGVANQVTTTYVVDNLPAGSFVICPIPN